MVARTQLARLGVDRFAIRRRVQAGALHPLHGGRVYAVGLNPLSRLGAYLAAVMAVGAGAVLSHRAAAALWGLRPSAALIDITVVRGRRKVRGLRVHHSRMLAPQDIAVKDGIPVTSVARTLLDLAEVLGHEDLEAAIDRAERLNIFDLTAVVDVLDRARGRKGAKALRRAIAAYLPSTQTSELERAFKRLLDAANDIPTPAFNALVEGETRTIEVDADWAPHRLRRMRPATRISSSPAIA